MTLLVAVPYHLSTNDVKEGLCSEIYCQRLLNFVIQNAHTYRNINVFTKLTFKRIISGKKYGCDFIITFRVTTHKRRLGSLNTSLLGYKTSGKKPQIFSWLTFNGCSRSIYFILMFSLPLRLRSEMFYLNDGGQVYGRR